MERTHNSTEKYQLKRNGKVFHHLLSTVCHINAILRRYCAIFKTSFDLINIPALMNPFAMAWAILPPPIKPILCILFVNDPTAHTRTHNKLMAMESDRRSICVSDEMAFTLRTVLVQLNS